MSEKEFDDFLFEIAALLVKAEETKRKAEAMKNKPKTLPLWAIKLLSGEPSKN